MFQNHWKKGMAAMAVTLWTLSAGTGLSLAEAPKAAAMPSRGASGFLATLEKTVGISTEQRDTIRGLLAEQREAMRSLREQTDKKIRAVLTSDQQRKFDALLAEQKVRRNAKGA